MPQNTTDRLHNFSALVVGDLDDNDTTLIIGFLDYHDMTNVTQHGYQTHGLKIFYFDKTEQQVKLKRSIPFPSGLYASTFGSIAIARHNNKGYIVVAGNDPTNDVYLYAYDTDGTQVWKSDQPYNNVNGYFTTMINIADFNHDGIPEVYAGNRIFSLETGMMLCSGGNTNNTGVLYHSGGDASIAADIVFDNGSLELCAGSQIYLVDIPPGGKTAGAGTMTMIADMQLPASRYRPAPSATAPHRWPISTATA
jgi:hypothetical protein